jgi:hypothetical protein
MNLHELGFEDIIIINSDTPLERRSEVFTILKAAGYKMNGTGRVYRLETEKTNWEAWGYFQNINDSLRIKAATYTDETFLAKYNQLVAAKNNNKSHPQPVFKVGDKVTFKAVSECKHRDGNTNSYWWGGAAQHERVTEILRYSDYVPKAKCYKIVVHALNNDGTKAEYSMLESEFKEYDKLKQHSMTPQQAFKPFPENWYLPQVDITKQEVIDLVTDWADIRYSIGLDQHVIVNKRHDTSEKRYYQSKAKFLLNTDAKVLNHQLITEEEFVAHYYPEEYQSIFNKPLTIKQFNHGLQESSQSITCRVSQPVTTGQRLSGISVSGRTKKAAITVRPIVYKAISSE